MSVVPLVRIEGLTLHVRDVDILDGTPVLDIKPYVSYVDAIDTAENGWLDRPADPRAGYEVAFAPEAAAQVEWLQSTQDIDLKSPLARLLALGPQPHPYRRIRKEGDGWRIAHKAWRAWFTIEGRVVTVTRIGSGYRARDLAMGSAPDLDVHRAFVVRFPAG